VRRSWRTSWLAGPATAQWVIKAQVAHECLRHVLLGGSEARHTKATIGCDLPEQMGGLGLHLYEQIASFELRAQAVAA